MTGRTWPARPVFADESERLVWDALVPRLRPDDALLHGLRITDPVEGEVEIDILLLMPDRGAAVIEVKGGHVTYADGRYRQTGRTAPVTSIPPGRRPRRRGPCAGSWSISPRGRAIGCAPGGSSPCPTPPSMAPSARSCGPAS